MRDFEDMSLSEYKAEDKANTRLEKLFDMSFYLCLGFWISFFVCITVMIITERLSNGLSH